MRMFSLLVAALVLTVSPALAQAQEPLSPHVKVSGHLSANSTMLTNFDPADYTYDRSRNLSRQSSDATLVTDEPGWGLSAQWSPDDRFWVEVGWQHAPTLTATVNSSQTFAIYLIPCSADSYCPFRFGDEQTNRHRITADDFALALKWDLTRDSKYTSVLLGGGVHRRYLHDTSAIVTTRWRDWFLTNNASSQFKEEREELSAVRRTNSASKTRLFLQADVELYPAGKNRFIGLGVSGRVLGAGDREQQFFTDTLTDKNILIGVKPGWYDVTARLIVRF